MPVLLLRSNEKIFVKRDVFQVVPTGKSTQELKRLHQNDCYVVEAAQKVDMSSNLKISHMSVIHLLVPEKKQSN